jgi:translation initiation factor IF-2
VNGGVLQKGLPSQPVRIIGFKSVPKAGDPIVCVESEEKARQLVERREAVHTSDPSRSLRPEGVVETELQVTGKSVQRSHVLQSIHEKYDFDPDVVNRQIRIPVVIKADADGTLAAVRESLVAIGEESSLDMVIDPISTGIGPITLSDVGIASDSGATIFSFNVRQTDRAAMKSLEESDVKYCTNNVIYSLLDDAKNVFAEYLPPAPVEHVHGRAEVKAIFSINNKKSVDNIAGLRVLEGSLYKSKARIPDGGDSLVCHYRVLRNGERVSPEGEKVRAASLRRVKEDVEDVRRGEECGLGLSGFSEFQEGDIIECYSVEMKKVFV